MHTIFSVSAVVKISGTRSPPEIFKSNPGSAKPMMTQAYLVQSSLSGNAALIVPSLYMVKGHIHVGMSFMRSNCHIS